MKSKSDLAEEVSRLEREASEAFKAPHNKEELEQLRVAYLGRKGKIALIINKLSSLSISDRKYIGEKINIFKKTLTAFFESREIIGEGEKALDATLPGIRASVGHLHPITQFLRKVVSVFQSMGFEIVEGPEVETESYNFDLLNIPQAHPARDMHDTFWLKQTEELKNRRTEKLLLRTHTSPVQLRAMESRRPPVRIIVPGRVFRHEATDPGHETTFYQCEGFVIDKGVRVTDLIGTLQEFLKAIFGKVKTRVRPHYYPFVEPGMDVDMSCLICAGRGCSVCKRSGWLEMLGSGMVHPKVLRNMKVDPKVWTGFAFGLGIDRFMMLYYGVDDVRLSYSGDLRFIKQF